MRDIELWAHRGSHGGRIIENTLAAFERALAEGAAGVELDVRASGDGHAIVIHDQDLRRLGGDGGLVEARPYAVTRAVRLPGGSRVPSLAEVLALVAGRIPVNVELKSLAAARPALAVIGPADRVVLSSFLPEALALCAREAPGLPRALLTERAAGEAPPWAALRALRCVAWHAWHERLTGSEVAAARARGLTVRAYTVAHPGDLARLAAMGVAGAFVDRPGALARRSKRAAPSG